MKNLLILLATSLCLLSAASWAERALTLKSVQDFTEASAALETMFEKYPDDEIDENDSFVEFFNEESINEYIDKLNKAPFKAEALAILKRYNFKGFKDYFLFMKKTLVVASSTGEDSAEMKRMIPQLQAAIKKAEANKQPVSELKGVLEQLIYLRDAVKDISPADMAMIKKHPEIIDLINAYNHADDEDGHENSYEDDYEDDYENSYEDAY